MDKTECGCAVTLDGLIELSHPKCPWHYDKPAYCPLHGGDWAGYQCDRKHDHTEDELLAEVIRAHRAAVEVSWEAATQIALYGSAFIQIDRVPNEAPKVTVLNTVDVQVRRR